MGRLSKLAGLRVLRVPASMITATRRVLLKSCSGLQAGLQAVRSSSSIAATTGRSPVARLVRVVPPGFPPPSNRNDRRTGYSGARRCARRHARTAGRGEIRTKVTPRLAPLTLTSMTSTRRRPCWTGVTQWYLCDGKMSASPCSHGPWRLSVSSHSSVARSPPAKSERSESITSTVTKLSARKRVTRARLREAATR